MVHASMRICITVNAAWNIWNFRRPLVETLLREGHSIHILAPRDAEACKLVEIGCHFHHLDMDRKGLNPLGGLSLVRSYGQAFDSIGPDIVLGFTIKNNLFGIMAARKRAIPFIPNVTGLGTAFLGGVLLRRISIALYRNAFRDCPVVFFQNRDDFEMFQSLGIVSQGQGRVIPGSGIDLSHFLPTPLPTGIKTTFLMIARLLRDKGVLEYIEAAKMILAEGLEAKFQLLGPLDPANRTAISALEIEEWSMFDGIEYLGTSEDTRVEITKANCVVLPSYREGAPRTLIEAAAMQRPLIATDVPGCTAVVDDGENGLLCRAHDAGDLAAKMRIFLNMSASEQSAMGKCSRRKMEREFDASIVTDAYRAAIQELTGSKLATASFTL